jgi:hypothetical protein
VAGRTPNAKAVAIAGLIKRHHEGEILPAEVRSLVARYIAIGGRCSVRTLNRKLSDTLPK